MSSSDTEGGSDDAELIPEIRTRLRKQTQNATKSVTKDPIEYLSDPDTDDNDVDLSYDDSEDSDYAPEYFPNRARMPAKPAGQSPVILDGLQIDEGSDVIDITCGEVAAKFHRRRFICPGIYTDCIEYKGQFLTPKAFTVLADKVRSRDWKRSIKLDINNKTIRTCMRIGLLDFYDHENNCSGRCRSWNTEITPSTSLLSATSPSTTPLPATPLYAPPPSGKLASLLCSTPTIPTRQSENQDESISRLNSGNADAAAYYELVRVHFGDESPVYKSFLSTVGEFISKHIDPPEMIRRLFDLFKDHPNLLSGLNNLLPPTYRVKIENNEIEVFESEQQQQQHQQQQQQQQTVSETAVEQNTRLLSSNQIQEPTEENSITGTCPTSSSLLMHRNRLSVSLMNQLNLNRTKETTSCPSQQTVSQPGPKMVEPSQTNSSDINLKEPTEENSIKGTCPTSSSLLMHRNRLSVSLMNQLTLNQTKETTSCPSQQTVSQPGQKTVEPSQTNSSDINLKMKLNTAPLFMHFPPKGRAKNLQRMLDTAPVITHFPPRGRARNADTTGIHRSGVVAEQIAKQVQERTDIQKPGVLDPNAEVIDISVGKQEAKFHRKLYKCSNRPLKCIEYDGNFITPSSFMRIAGKEAASWKSYVMANGRAFRYYFKAGMIDFFNHKEQCSGKCKHTQVRNPECLNSENKYEDLELDPNLDVLDITCKNLKAKFHRKLHTCSSYNQKFIEYDGELMVPRTLMLIADLGNYNDWKAKFKYNGTTLRDYYKAGLLDYYNHKEQCSGKCRGMLKNKSAVLARDLDSTASNSLNRIMENQINIMEKSWKYHGILLKKKPAVTDDLELDPSADVLDITCRNLKAKFHRKLYLCSMQCPKCIEYNGEFITPKNLMCIADYVTFKNWKNAFKLNGKPIRCYINAGLIDFYDHKNICSGNCREKKLRNSTPLPALELNYPTPNRLTSPTLNSPLNLESGCNSSKGGVTASDDVDDMEDGTDKEISFPPADTGPEVNDNTMDTTNLSDLNALETGSSSHPITPSTSQTENMLSSGQSIIVTTSQLIGTTSQPVIGTTIQSIVRTTSLPITGTGTGSQPSIGTTSQPIIGTFVGSSSQPTTGSTIQPVQDGTKTLPEHVSSSPDNTEEKLVSPRLLAAAYLGYLTKFEKNSQDGTPVTDSQILTLDEFKKIHSQHEFDNLNTVTESSSGLDIVQTSTTQCKEDEDFLQGLTEGGMLNYLVEVKDQLGKRSPVYFGFLNIVREFTCKRIDAPSLKKRVLDLLKDHPNLLEGFKKLLPFSYKDSIEENQMNKVQSEQQTVQNRPQKQVSIESQSASETNEPTESPSNLTAGNVQPVQISKYQLLRQALKSSSSDRQKNTSLNQQKSADDSTALSHTNNNANMVKLEDKTGADVAQSAIKRPLEDNTSNSCSSKRKDQPKAKESSRKEIENTRKANSYQALSKLPDDLSNENSLHTDHTRNKPCAKKRKKRKRERERVYTCDTCNKKYEDIHRLLYHIKTHFAHREKFKCKYCAKEYVADVVRIAHERIHTGETPFKCKSCEKAFRTKDLLEKHKVDEHGMEKPYLCDFCGKAFRTAKNYNEHMSCHGEKTRECIYCSKRFTNTSQLLKHVRLNHRILSCDICSEIFESKRKLQRHKMTHFKKEFQCDQCEASFSQNCNLTKHKIIHLGLKPYKCHMCTCAYAHRSNLNAHMKKVHNQMPELIGWIGLRVQK